MKVTVAYATPKKQVEIALELDAGATVEQAIDASGIAALFTEIDRTDLTVGIFSQRAKCLLSSSVKQLWYNLYSSIRSPPILPFFS